MKYILINPVTDRMFVPEYLEALLREGGFQRVYCETDWAAVVKEKYQTILEQSEGMVVDMRCPLACKIPKDMDRIEGGNLIYPDIEPILIHCAREISSRWDLHGAEKIITTPCRALAELGNKLELPETRFLSWNDFVAELSEKEGISKSGITSYHSQSPPDMTPIPLGFFRELPFKQKSISGENSIREFFSTENEKKVRLAELLYCQDGCHNGDGIRKDEVNKV